MEIQHANRETPSSVGIFRACRKRDPPATVAMSNSTPMRRGCVGVTRSSGEYHHG